MRSELAALALASVVALVDLAAVGCTTAVTGGAAVQAPPLDAKPRGEAPSGHDLTLSGPEAAALLRRAAVIAALTDPEGVLDHVWDDARTWPDPSLLLAWLDPLARASTQTSKRGLIGETHDLRRAMARAWLERGDRERARLFVASLAQDERRDVELTFAVEGREAAQRMVDDELKRHAPTYIDGDGVEVDSFGDPIDQERDDDDERLAVAEARWGDPARAVAHLDALDPAFRCEPEVALAQRRERDGGTDVGSWLDAAEASLEVQDRIAPNLVVACAVGIILTANQVGDVARVHRVFALAPDWRTEWTCHITARTLDAVDPTTLDVPLAVAAEQVAATGVGPWKDGCPGLMAELAARRGDRHLAQRFLSREGDVAEIDATENPRYDWSARVRLGREDPFAPHLPLYRVFDLLLLARIFDGQGDTRIDRARLVEALKLEPSEGARGSDAE